MGARSLRGYGNAGEGGDNADHGCYCQQRKSDCSHTARFMCSSVWSRMARHHPASRKGCTVQGCIDGDNWTMVHREGPTAKNKTGAGSLPRPFATHSIPLLLTPYFLLPSRVSRLPSPVSRLLSPVSSLPSPASCLPSPVSRLPSHVSRLTTPKSAPPSYR